MNDNVNASFQFGMIGLGTMGRNLLLNMADNGFSVSGFDKNEKMVQLLESEGAEHHLKGYTDIHLFIAALQRPRKLILLVPAGPIVDSVIAELEPLLEQGDILIDSGNSYFGDTARRADALHQKGFHFFGMGISGGEEGARFGPSLMPGGDKEAYQAVKPMLEAVSAKVNGAPCVSYIGPGASGHFVKMTHNGIEYAIMELLAETYDILKNGMGYDNNQMAALFEKWNTGRLNAFLMEITAEVFRFRDEETGAMLLDQIKDEARSKGTGKWTSQIAMDLEVPIPVIDAAVSQRNLSKLKGLRVGLSASREDSASREGRTASTHLDLRDDELEAAFFFAMVSAYAQGIHLLAEASSQYGYQLQMAEIAKIWRGGCIIRASFLEDIYQAYLRQADLAHLFADRDIAQKLEKSLAAAKKVITQSLQGGLGIPAFAATLAYYESIHTARMSSNLTQAQRDLFGAHTFERLDREGIFHAHWKTNQA